MLLNMREDHFFPSIIMRGNIVKRWLFIAGLVLAVLPGLFIQAAWASWVLAAIGLVVAFSNIAEENHGIPNCRHRP